MRAQPQPAIESAAADPTGRYEVIKIFRVNVDHYKFYKEVFDKLPVELMRWVFENRISNEELLWLANYTLNFKKADGSALNESERLGAYTYTYTDSKGGVHFRWVNDTFYNKHDIEVEAKVLDRPATQQNEEASVKGGWRELYKFTYDDANFPNAKEGDPYRLTYEILDHDQIQKLANQGKHLARLWMVFQRGGVCGAIAKTFENLNGMAGHPLNGSRDARSRGDAQVHAEGEQGDREDRAVLGHPEQRDAGRGRRLAKALLGRKDATAAKLNLAGSAEEVRKLSRFDASEGAASSVPSFLAPVLAAGAAAALFVRRKRQRARTSGAVGPLPAQHFRCVYRAANPIQFPNATEVTNWGPNP